MMMRNARRKFRTRRGSVYVLMLSIAMLVAAIAYGSIAVVRAQARAADLQTDIADARLAASSAIELARLWVSQDPSWRVNRPNGTWASNISVAGAKVTIEGVDPLDANLSNRPNDSLVLTATALKGQARQIAQVTLVAAPQPLPALGYPIHTGGQLHIRASKTLTARLAAVNTNGSFRNDATLISNLEAGSINKLGTVTGTVTSPAPPKAMPDSTIPEMYAALGSLLSVQNLDRAVLAPGKNAYGSLNAEGVYVIRSTADVTIKDSRINGTLVVICPGRKVTFDGEVLIQPFRADYPAVIVNGDAIFKYDSGTPLSESSKATNFNPTGAPYIGSADTDTGDLYPSEIQGLIHVTGSASFSTKPTCIRGAIISESNLAADAIDVGSDLEVVYDPNLYTNPPQGYTTSVLMPVLSGSWKRIVN